MRGASRSGHSLRHRHVAGGACQCAARRHLARPVAHERSARVDAEDLTCTVRGRRHPQAAQRPPARPGPVLPHRSRRRRQPRRHGGNARLRHQRRALRHHARERAGADRGHADGEIIRTARRAKKSAAGYDLTRLLVGSEGTLGVITEVTLRLYGIPEAIAAAVCPFPRIEGACNAAIPPSRPALPVARIELLDAMQVRACNIYSKLTSRKRRRCSSNSTAARVRRGTGRAFRRSRATMAAATSNGDPAGGPLEAVAGAA